MEGRRERVSGVGRLSGPESRSNWLRSRSHALRRAKLEDGNKVVEGGWTGEERGRVGAETAESLVYSNEHGQHLLALVCHRLRVIS